MAVDGGKIRISTELDTKDFTVQIEETEMQLKNLQSALEKARPGDNIMEMRVEIEKTENRLLDLYKKQLQIDKVDYSNITKGLNTVSKKTSSIIRQVVRWAGAIFGIRSAYNLVRSSMSTIMSYDEQLNADVQYMKNAIAFALEPVVRAIVNLMKQLMQYVGYIIYAWTGKNIFENANKSLEKSNKEAKKLHKTLASFDEMNIMQDSSSGDKGTTGPSFDLTSPEDVNPPSWLTWIVEHKDGILAVLGGIAGFLTGIKLGLGGIKSIGIGSIIGGAILTIQKLIKYFDKLDGALENNGTSWEDLGGIVKGWSLILIGVGLVTGQVEIAIAGLILLLVSIIMENWGKIKEILTNAQNTVYEKLNWLQENLGIIGRFIYGKVDAIRDWIVDRVKGIFIPIKNVFDGILLLFKGDFQNGVKNIVKGLLNFVIGKINLLIDGLNAFLTPLRAVLTQVSKISGKNYSMSQVKIPRIPYLAKGGIINLPNKGVMVGSAVAGESGREGVLPLTDSQAMQQLGQAIGKYITINANITNTMNGRVISRELQKINNENIFAYNR